MKVYLVGYTGWTDEYLKETPESYNDIVGIYSTFASAKTKMKNEVDRERKERLEVYSDEVLQINIIFQGELELPHPLPYILPYIENAKCMDAVAISAYDTFETIYFVAEVEVKK